MKETEQEVGSMPQANKATIEHGAHFGFTSWTSILETFLDISMAIFFWVEFWRISRQLLNQDFRMVLQVCFGELAAMGPSTIPNQDDFARDVLGRCYSASMSLWLLTEPSNWIILSAQ